MDLKNIKEIPIYETNYKSHHKYVRVVLNLEDRKVIFEGLSRKTKTLEPFWKMLGKRRCSKIEAVVTDLDKPYQKAVLKTYQKLVKFLIITIWF